MMFQYFTVNQYVIEEENDTFPQQWSRVQAIAPMKVGVQQRGRMT